MKIAREIIENLLSNAESDRPPVIIFQSDHGVRNIDYGSATLDDYPEEFKTPEKDIPSFQQHKEFVENFLENNSKNNYDVWYMISILENNIETKIGSIALKKDGEWGYHLLMNHWNKGIGQAALKKLIELHPRKKFVARIKVGNKRAIHIAEKFGHELKELTYVRESE